MNYRLREFNEVSIVYRLFNDNNVLQPVEKKGHLFVPDVDVRLSVLREKFSR